VICFPALACLSLSRKGCAAGQVSYLFGRLTAMPRARWRAAGSYPEAIVSSAQDMQDFWESAYQQNDPVHWLVLSDYLDENELPSVAAALRRAAEAVPPGAGLQPEQLLPLAAEAGQMKVVQQLLERGVGHYNHAQRAAARAGQNEVLAVLLEDAARRCRQGGWILHEDIGPTDPFSFDLMMVERRPENEPVCESEALVDAAKAGRQRTVELLLSYGGATGYGDAIRGAAMGGQREIVEWLLERGAPPQEGLSGAVYAGPREMIAFLLDRGAEPDSLTCATAAAYRDLSVVDLLLQHGGSPNWGLSDAACRGRKDTVEFLLQRGAKPDAHNLSAAINAGHLQIAELLERHGAALGREGSKDTG
jgi:ankyrin repeat protein